MTMSYRVGAAIVAAVGLACSGTAQGGITFFRLFGDSSPADRSLTNVHVLGYFPEDGGGYTALGAWAVADAPIGEVTPIDFNSSAIIDVSGGLYAIIGVNEAGGVSITLPDSAFSEGVTEWEDLFTTAESTVKGWLEASDESQLYNWFNNQVIIPGIATAFGTRATFVDFSTAETNGDGVVNFQIVPAPATALAFGALGLSATRQRR